MNEKQKLELGIEIISGMKASAYGVSIEEGREMAMEETDFPGILERLHEQAFFIVDITLKKLEQLGFVISDFKEINEKLDKIINDISNIGSGE